MDPSARWRLIAITAENIRGFLAGKPVNVVNAVLLTQYYGPGKATYKRS
jgi:hypothetical protein